MTMPTKKKKAAPKEVLRDVDIAQPPAVSNPVGRPTKYSPALADRICRELAMGYSMRTVCKNDWCPEMAAIFRWLREKTEFREQYEKAKQESTDAMAEDIMDIADDGTNDWMEIERQDGSTKTVIDTEHIQRSRLRVDTRKWLMAKMKPKKYGDKLDLTTDGKKLPTPIYGGQSKK